MLNILISDMCLEITNLLLQPHVPWTNGLTDLRVVSPRIMYLGLLLPRRWNTRMTSSLFPVPNRSATGHIMGLETVYMIAAVPKFDLILLVTISPTRICSQKNVPNVVNVHNS